MNTEKLASTQLGRSPQRLEGSRFIIGQLCKLAASGSRERLLVVQFYRSRGHPSASEQSRWEKPLRWVIPGSRLLPSDRTAVLQSGSPPSGGGVQCRFA
jgi:hypothetical protein